MHVERRTEALTGHCEHRTPESSSTSVTAGNRARLHLRSDLPAGSFSLQLYALSPDFGCTGGEPSGYRLAAVLTLGAQKARVALGHFPTLTVHGSSRLQLPVVEEGF